MLRFLLSSTVVAVVPMAVAILPIGLFNLIDSITVRKTTEILFLDESMARSSAAFDL